MVACINTNDISGSWHIKLPTKKGWLNCFDHKSRRAQLTNIKIYWCYLHLHVNHQWFHFNAQVWVTKKPTGSETQLAKQWIQSLTRVSKGAENALILSATSEGRGNTVVGSAPWNSDHNIWEFMSLQVKQLSIYRDLLPVPSPLNDLLKIF